MMLNQSSSPTQSIAEALEALLGQTISNGSPALLQPVGPAPGAIDRIAAPRFGTLPDMENGQRVVVAANGVFVQVKLDWLDCTLRLADIGSVPPLPYGTVQERLVFSFGVIPVRLLEAFIEAGRAKLPDEVAGGLIYSRHARELRLEVFEALQTSPDRIDYRMPKLHDDESIAIDLHTHGRSRALWSLIDDRDDQGVKVAGVFGHLHHERPSAAFRLAVNGYYKSLRHPWEVARLSDDDLEPKPGGSILTWLRWTRGVTWNI